MTEAVSEISEKRLNVRFKSLPPLASVTLGPVFEFTIGGFTKASTRGSMGSVASYFGEGIGQGFASYLFTGIIFWPLVYLLHKAKKPNDWAYVLWTLAAVGMTAWSVRKGGL